MASPAPFSRLQLAAALLEYDNDPDNPDAPYRSAQDSAIFAHLRRNPAARPELAARKSEYLTSEGGSIGGRESTIDVRRSRGSRGSIDALRNPFGGDIHSETGHYEEDDESPEDLEVDLASWGLEAFMPKDKGSKSAKARGKQPAVSSTRSRYASTSHDSTVPVPRRGIVTTKSMSVGGQMDFDTEKLQEDRRRSFGSPLDLVGMEATDIPFAHRRVSSQASLAPSQAMMVPFPSGSVRSPSPRAEHALDARSVAHGRTYSTASMNSKFFPDGMGETGPRQRITSIGTMDALESAEDNPFAIKRPAHTSRFDPKSASRARSYSNASLGSRMVLESDGASVMTGNPYARECRLSTLELLRPKVLVMPSPLQPVSTNVAPEPTRRAREGFELTTDGPPLPPGARSSRRLSISLSVFDSGAENVPLASNSFTPNPLLDLTPSQKLFRNTLVVGGLSSANDMPRATQDGEQAQLDPSGTDEVPATQAVGEVIGKSSRPAGKLYGKSLIDDLENRKAQMRSKQRVFTGDQRPSMMARSQQRSSTLIDPASLQIRPSAQRMSSYGSQNAEQGLEKRKSRRGSLNAKPLLNFDDENKGKAPQLSPNPQRLPTNPSVFGVDTLWEREMAKLKEMQAIEAIEKEEQRKAEADVERMKAEKKNKRKKKGKGKDNSPEQVETPPNEDLNIAVAPPILPDIQRATRRTLPKPSDSDVSSESDDETPARQRGPDAPAWHDSSDEEGVAPRRTTGVGPRNSSHGRKTTLPQDDHDSEEDVPLAATIYKAVVRASLSPPRRLEDSDDDDRPLSQVVRSKASLSPIPPTFSKLTLNSLENAPDSDDDQPLGLRASRIPSGLSNTGNDDDMPLAFHPEQQRRTQYQMFAQQQQQQQQMLMQAQMQSNMMMNASMMGPNYFAPTIMNPMVMMQPQVPMPIPSPPPMVDPAKFGSVDRWRRGVAVEGENP
ncbi:hypothetical protein NLJ89_g1820 [Agrocybe chaxingu]|uniref:Uncharacterized protein n=1 Tax=Agrocybe chaxingu TaxID=84603 RepID=A0A9W8MZB0_9AGAR|nr:hypothetical protein NLJ89_g1820 [Agrocybe chaxingu]